MEKGDRKQQQQQQQQEATGPRLYRVRSPVKTYTGDAHGMKFQQGEAVTHDRGCAERAFLAGYDVADAESGERWKRPGAGH